MSTSLKKEKIEASLTENVKKKRGEFIWKEDKLENNLFFLITLLLFFTFIHFFGESILKYLEKNEISGEEIVIGFGFSLYFSIFWIVGGFYLFLDHLIEASPLSPLSLSLAKKKIQPSNTLPTPSLSWTCLIVLRNQFFGTLPSLFLSSYYLRSSGVFEPDFLYSISSLSPLSVLLNLVVIIFIEDLFFFTAHYLIHTPFLYPKIHKQHHEYIKSIAIVTHYVTFVEHILGNMIPFLGGIWITKCHPFVSFLWVVLGVVTALHTHSNYDFSFMPSAHYHDFHHYNFQGNYGVGFCLLDWIFGTDKKWREMIAQQRLKEKKEKE